MRKRKLRFKPPSLFTKQKTEMKNLKKEEVLTQIFNSDYQGILEEEYVKQTLSHKKQFFNLISENLQFDIVDFVSLKEIDSFDELEEELHNSGAFNIEIIYYSKALEYLEEHDASLKYCLSLAADNGYETKDISSELLATLLASENALQEFHNYTDEIVEFFDGNSLILQEKLSWEEQDRKDKQIILKENK